MLVRINRGLLNELKRNGYILIEKKGVEIMLLS